MSTTSIRARNAASTAAALDNPTYQYYVLFVLSLSYVFNVIDRGVLSILQQDIREELEISRTAMGLLTGLGFGLFYAVMTIPIARLADRWSRVHVLALATSLWSVATALCGTAFNYASLAVFRTTTGVGEAGGTPPSHSLISDYFPTSKRATALAIYAMSVPIGTAIGSLVSGWSNIYFGWRQTFLIVGLPGVAAALLVWLTVKEPPRGYADGPQSKPKLQTPAFLEVCRFLLTRKSFMHMSVAAALHAVMWYAGSNWNAEFFRSYHGMNSGITGNYLATFALIGALGSFLGGYLADRLSTRHNDKRWYMWVPALACLLMVPLQFASYLSSNLAVVVPAFSAMVVLASMFFGPSFSVAQSIATVRMRAVAASVLLFIQSIIGLTLGAALPGAISDLLAASTGRMSLPYAMVIVGVANVWAAIHYFLGARNYREDLAQTAALNAAAK